jgi:hypothetical protein
MNDISVESKMTIQEKVKRDLISNIINETIDNLSFELQSLSLDELIERVKDFES